MDCKMTQMCVGGSVGLPRTGRYYYDKSVSKFLPICQPPKPNADCDSETQVHGCSAPEQRITIIRAPPPPPQPNPYQFPPYFAPSMNSCYSNPYSFCGCPPSPYNMTPYGPSCIPQYGCPPQYGCNPMNFGGMGMHGGCMTGNIIPMAIPVRAQCLRRKDKCKLMKRFEKKLALKKAKESKEKKKKSKNSGSSGSTTETPGSGSGESSTSKGSPKGSQGSAEESELKDS